MLNQGFKIVLTYVFVLLFFFKHGLPATSLTRTGSGRATGGLRPPSFTATTRIFRRSPVVRFLIIKRLDFCRVSFTAFQSSAEGGTWHTMNFTKLRQECIELQTLIWKDTDSFLHFWWRVLLKPTNPIWCHQVLDFFFFYWKLKLETALIKW